jgi:hypothetical protein
MTRQENAMKSLPLQTFCGITESTELPDKLRKLNAKGKWPKAPKAEPTIEEVGKRFIEDGQNLKVAGMADVTLAIEIIAGPDKDTGGAIGSFARLVWQVMPKCAMISLPHGSTREEAVQWLEEAQRLIVNYWGALLSGPEQMSGMLHTARVKNWKAAQKRKPRPVKDDDPMTWPDERRDLVGKAISFLGMKWLIELQDADLDDLLKRFLKHRPDIAADVRSLVRCEQGGKQPTPEDERRDNRQLLAKLLRQWIDEQFSENERAKHPSIQITIMDKDYDGGVGKGIDSQTGEVVRRASPWERRRSRQRAKK